LAVAFAVTANVTNATTATVCDGAVVSGQTVTILADVANLSISVPTTFHGFGLIVVPQANSTSNVASTARG
jgi:hypothetical protein